MSTTDINKINNTQPHSDAPKVGYLLINLGTPKSYAVKDVRSYLNEFLMDPYVLDTPWILRRLIVSAFILPLRPKASAAAYESIWQKDGSPLLIHSQALCTELEEKLEAPVALGMRYGQPNIDSAVQRLSAAGVEQITIVPLYPHYADSTVTTSIKLAERIIATNSSIKQSSVLPTFYQNAQYIAALANNVRRHLPENWDHLLLSYHGLPERHLTRTDPTGKHCLASDNCCNTHSVAHSTCYRHQVFATSNALAQALQLNNTQYSVSFQSRLGRLPWLTPYTDHVLAELPSKGVKHLAVACPAFVADNLETLEEMGIQGRKTFLDAGGESFTLIPCLNQDEQWVTALANMLSSGN